jgi:hypothetical protein
MYPVEADLNTIIESLKALVTGEYLAYKAVEAYKLKTSAKELGKFIVVAEAEPCVIVMNCCVSVDSILRFCAIILSSQY